MQLRPRATGADAYGVAGSWVVPTTRSGGAPAACTAAGLSRAGTGQNVHGRPSHTFDAPKCGATRAAAVGEPLHRRDASAATGASRQPIA